MRKRLSILAVLLLAVAISAYSVGGTYAKYTSSISGSTSTARVAKWAFEFKQGDEAATTNTFTFNLFDTVKEADTSSTEEHVHPSNTADKVIAPGTGGSFSIKLTNKSEVDATYAVNYTVTNTGNIPVEFSLDGSTWVAWNALSNVSDTAIAPNGEADIKIYWRWAFTVADDGTTDTVDEAAVRNASDTDLGTATDLASIVVGATVVVNQVD